MSRRHALGLLAVLAVSACKEPPSFRVRWHLQDRFDEVRDRDPDGAPKDPPFFDVTRAIDCTALGINAVQVTSIDGFGEVADARIYPCFTERFEDPDAQVGGPTLDPGPYAIEVRGVQRNGEPWLRDDIAEDDRACDPNETGNGFGCNAIDVACDCLRVDVVDQATEDLGIAKLGPAPRECVDGIDNDRDGLVDAQELICQRMPDSFEGNNVSRLQFSLVTTVWDDQPEVSCGELGLTSIAARLCNLEGAEPVCEPIATPACIERAPVFFQGEANMGTYAVELTGVDSGGNALTEPQLSPSFKVDDTGIGATVMLTADFGADDFLTPVHDFAKFTVGFEQGPGLSVRDECGKGGRLGQLSIAQLSFELRDGHGGVLADPIGVGSPPFGRVTLDGVPFACFQGEVTTQKVDWGGYTLQVEAYAEDGTVCFSSGDAPLSIFPGTTGVVVPRVLVDGVPPASCRDCENDADCNGATCTDGICQI